VTEYFTKEEVLGIIQAGINSYDDLIIKAINHNDHVFSLSERRAELEDLLIQFKNRLSTKK